MKHKCCKCANIALWFYAPSDSKQLDKDRYFCDDCISRGCSCVYIEEIGEYEIDEANGEPLPCVEYIYSAEGFDFWSAPCHTDVEIDLDGTIDNVEPRTYVGHCPTCKKDYLSQNYGKSWELKE